MWVESANGLCGGAVWVEKKGDVCDSHCFCSVNVHSPK